MTEENVAKPAKKKFDRFRMETGTVGGFISDAWEQITGLGEEFREMYDNAPENLQQTSVNQTRDETASNIENLSEPCVNSSVLEELDCSTQLDMGKVYRGRQRQSRACQAGNAASMFRAASEAIREWQESNVSPDDDEEAAKKQAEELKIDFDDYKAAHDEADDLASELESLADEIDGFEFPGMFG